MNPADGAAPSTTRGTARRPSRRRLHELPEAAPPAPEHPESRVNGTRPDGTPGATAAGPPDRAREPDDAGTGHHGEPDVWDRRVAAALAFARRRLTGDYEVDEFGFDPQLTEQLWQPVLRRLYRDWFRVEVSGVEHLPTKGPALVVANHSGTLAMDALMLSLAVHDETPERRFLRLLGADLVFRLPFVSELARKSGGTLACQSDAERLLGNGELVGVFPEGFKGIGKPFRERYKLQRFGRGGFVSAALRTETPIIPAAIVGAEEIYPLIGDIKPLARLLGTPYFPVTPTFPWLGPLGLIPLPSKWLIRFGDPIDTTGQVDDADDPGAVFNLADLVRETIQQMLHELLVQRGDPFGITH